MSAAFLCTTPALPQNDAIAEIAGDATAGENVYQSVCRNCHGPTGAGMASFPKLAGNESEYLIERLAQYRAGERIGPNSALMWPLVEDFSDQDIADIVAYISETF
ncbi:c-type cytochrome [Pontivivens ytuae]|uniref:C-type cytochrome n=1 Tax=Pontivivens ytuae TaxID=2789856 RepID=A0A7S9LVM8_9RHOB|nr:c-type cytochrome [Pontivivens ytuae]